jgi:hypothetical protein
MLDGRMASATSLTSLPGSVMAEVMLERKLMAFSFRFRLRRDARVGGGRRLRDG